MNRHYIYSTDSTVRYAQYDGYGAIGRNTPNSPLWHTCDYELMLAVL